MVLCHGTSRRGVRQSVTACPGHRRKEQAPCQVNAELRTGKNWLIRGLSGCPRMTFHTAPSALFHPRVAHFLSSPRKECRMGEASPPRERSARNLGSQRADHRARRRSSSSPASRSNNSRTSGALDSAPLRPRASAPAATWSRPNCSEALLSPASGVDRSLSPYFSAPGTHSSRPILPPQRLGGRAAGYEKRN